MKFSQYIFAIVLIFFSACKKAPEAPEAPVAQAAPTIPSVITEITDVQNRSVVCIGKISDDGKSTVKTRGFCFSWDGPDVTLNNSLFVEYVGAGSGEFSYKLTNLMPPITYYIRAFATNDVGTAYGGVQSIIAKN